WGLASGKKLYKAQEGETLFDVARRAIVPPLPERGHPQETELRAILGRAMTRNREERTRTAGELLRELSTYASRAGLVLSAVRLRRFLSESFAGPVLDAQRRRELATVAMSRGPLAILEEKPIIVTLT